MARPFKDGLDYFPLNTDFFNDDKILFVSSRFDEKGELIAIKLLCKIYNAGYYIKWNEDVCLLFAKVAGRNITYNLVNDVVNELVKRGFFNQTLFERFDILTSNGIQKRYIKACKDSNRKCTVIEPKYNLLELSTELTKLSTELTQLNPELSTQSKVKYKEKEYKEILYIPKNKYKNWSEQEFREEVKKLDFGQEHKKAFFVYWTEKSSSGKMKFQLEKTWETSKRLHYWVNNSPNKKQSFNGTFSNKALDPPENLTEVIYLPGGKIMNGRGQILQEN